MERKFILKLYWLTNLIKNAMTRKPGDDEKGNSMKGPRVSREERKRALSLTPHPFHVFIQGSSYKYTCHKILSLTCHHTSHHKTQSFPSVSPHSTLCLPSSNSAKFSRDSLKTYLGCGEQKNLRCHWYSTGEMS